MREPSQGAPSGKGDWHQHGLEAGFARDDFEQFLVGVDARTTAFIRDRRRFALQHSGDRLRHIFHVGRLLSRKVTAEHWIDGEPAEKLEDGGEKRVVPSKHHCGADDYGVGKGGPNRQFAFASLADIERGGGGVRTDTGNMDEPLDPGAMRLSCYPFGRLDMHGMKRLLSVLDVKTDRIYHPVGACECIGHGPLVVNVSCDRLKLRIIKTEQPVPPIRMP